jgi:hypothetical protein
MATGSTLQDYVRKAPGTATAKQYGTDSLDSLKEKMTEICGADVSDATSSLIEGQHITTLWCTPGLLSVFDDYWFFYIENNNVK